MPSNVAPADIISDAEERDIILRTLISLAETCKLHDFPLTGRQRATLNFCLALLDPEDAAD